MQLFWREICGSNIGNSYFFFFEDELR